MVGLLLVLGFLLVAATWTVVKMVESDPEMDRLRASVERRRAAEDALRRMGEGS